MCLALVLLVAIVWIFLIKDLERKIKNITDEKPIEKPASGKGSFNALLKDLKKMTKHK